MSQEILSPKLSMPSFSFKLPETFNKFAESRSWEPGWLVDYRKDCWDKFSSIPEKTIKDERWRFSPRSRFSLGSIESFANPKKSLEIESNHSNDGVFIDLLDRLILDQPLALSGLPQLDGPNLGADENSLLTGAFAETGFLLRVSKSVQSDIPIIINHHDPGVGKIAFHHNLIELEDYSEITVIEKFSSQKSFDSGYISTLLKVQLGTGAKLNRIVIQECSRSSTLIHLENFVIGKDANLTTTSLHLGGAQSRVESKGILSKPGSHFEYGSLNLGTDDQLFDQRTIQVHKAPHCTSNLLCKNALRKEAKSIFSGLIKVEEGAQHTDAYQTNRNLLLSDKAEADSLPGLEILANDVKCSHGATTSRIDPQELFYLNSRGIAEKESEKLIALGFLSEPIHAIKNESARELALNCLDSSLDS